MHGRLRNQYRREIKNAVKERDRRIKREQIKKSLNSMIDQNVENYTMEVIQNGENT